MMSRGSKSLGRSERVRGKVVSIQKVRGQIVRPGDLRNEVGFQNDINVLLAALRDGDYAWSTAAPLLSPDLLSPGYDDGPATLTDIKAAVESPAPMMVAAYAA